MRRRNWWVIGGATVAVLLAGCATAVGGSAGVDPQGFAGLAGPVTTTTPTTTTRTTPTLTRTTTTPTRTTGTITRSTDTGSGQNPYPTTPRQLPETPQTDQQAALLEGRRIAGYLPVPTQIEPSYRKNASMSTLPLKSASALSLMLTDPAPDVAQRYGMLAGFMSARNTTDKKSMLVAALEFPDSGSAQKAAGALAEAAHQDKDTGKVKVPGFDKAAGWAGKYSDSSYSHAFLAQGALVLYAWVQDEGTGDPAAQAALLGQALKAETTAMAAFKPAGKDGMRKLPTDVDGILAHTIPQPSEDATVIDGIYTAAAQLHFDTDPTETGRLFQAAGVDQVAQGKLTVYRAKDSAGAARIRDLFIDMMKGTDSAWKPYEFPGSVKEISCIQQALNSLYYCVAVDGRYAVEGYSSSEPDLINAFTAQTELLGQ